MDYSDFRRDILLTPSFVIPAFMFDDFSVGGGGGGGYGCVWSFKKKHGAVRLPIVLLFAAIGVGPRDQFD